MTVYVAMHLVQYETAYVISVHASRDGANSAVRAAHVKDTGWCPSCYSAPVFEHGADGSLNIRAEHERWYVFPKDVQE